MHVAVLFDPSSTAGEIALSAAVEEARRRSAVLVVLTALTGVGQDSPTELVEAREREALRGLVASRVPADLPWELDAPPPGTDAVGALVERVEALAPDLVVIGRRLRTAVGKFILGRTQQRLLMEIDRPILLVTVDAAPPR